MNLQQNMCGFWQPFYDCGWCHSTVRVPRRDQCRVRPDWHHYRFGHRQYASLAGRRSGRDVGCDYSWANRIAAWSCSAGVSVVRGTRRRLVWWFGERQKVQVPVQVFGFCFYRDCSFCSMSTTPTTRSSAALRFRTPSSQSTVAAAGRGCGDAASRMPSKRLGSRVNNESCSLRRLTERVKCEEMGSEGIGHAVWPYERSVDAASVMAGSGRCEIYNYDQMEGGHGHATLQAGASRRPLAGAAASSSSRETTESIALSLDLLIMPPRQRQETSNKKEENS